MILVDSMNNWWNELNYVQPGICEVAPKWLKQVVWKVGPYYKYKMIGDKLYVKKDKQWLRLKY